MIPRHTPSTYRAQIWREKVCEWCFKVVDHLGDDREVVYTAMVLLDRYTGAQWSHISKYTRHRYQTASMTALLIAMKLHGRTQFGINNLLRMGGGEISRDDVTRTSRDMIKSLSSEKCMQVRPSPMRCVKFIQNALRANFDIALGELVVETSIFLTELSVFDLRLSEKRAWGVAVGAIKTAMQLVEPSSLSPIGSALSTFQDIPTFDSQEVQVICRILLELHRQAPQTNQETNIKSTPVIVPLHEDSSLQRRESRLLETDADVTCIVPTEKNCELFTTLEPHDHPERCKQKRAQAIPFAPEENPPKRVRLE